MNTFRRTGLTLAITALLAACGGGEVADESPDSSRSMASRASTPSAQSPSSQDIVVQMKPGKSVSTVAASLGLGVVSQFGKRPIYLLRLPAGGNLDATLSALRKQKTVLFAERNRQGETPEGRRVVVWAIGTEGDYANQWAPGALRLTKAHERSLGDGVRVALLDTGADLEHPNLLPYFARDPNGHILGRDFVDGDAVAAERGSQNDIGFGHGTHVAGLVALAAPGARLMPVRVLDPRGRGNAWVLAEAIGWALDPDGKPATDDGAHVINLSLGTLKPTKLLKKVTALATCDFDDDEDDDDDDGGFSDPGFDDDRARCAAGHAALVTAAAGNSGTETEVLYPAAEDVKGALAVTASRKKGDLADFANRGGWIDLAAPGKDIVSTVPGGFGSWSGSSMAAPLAAGVAALVLATPAKDGNPALPALRQWTPEAVVKRLTDRSAELCGTSQRQVDANAAVRNRAAPDRNCP